jgi:hypothetical protein
MSMRIQYAILDAIARTLEIPVLTTRTRRNGVQEVAGSNPAVPILNM